MKPRIPQLDGLRGIAILIVIFHNTVPKFPWLPLQRLFSYGWMGVDLFFALSGFLITGILFDTKQSEGYFKTFYVRRCLRIWPLYYFVLFLMFAVLPVLRPSLVPTIMAKSSPWWAFPLFLQNFLIHPSTSARGPLGVSWSVAIEEQFYVVWAVVVRCCSYTQLRRIALSVICLSPFLRGYLSFQHVDIYSNVFCRLDGLMAGSLIALAVRSSTFVPARVLPIAWFALFAAVPAAMITEAYQTRWITYSLSTLASAALLYLSLFATQKWFRAALASRWLVYTGTISYGLYLLHKIPFDALLLFQLERHPMLAMLAGLVASYALAILSWYSIEKPFLNLNRFFKYERKPGWPADREYLPLPTLAKGAGLI